MFVALFGPPGVGKGTQAAVLYKELGVPHVATGDIFRKNVKEGTSLGKLAKSYMDVGQLVPDEVVWNIVEDRLGQADCAQGVLLDGFPRSIRQAELLMGWLKTQGKALQVVLALTAPDEALISRLAGRRTCLNCGATYHVETNPPRVAAVCDVCGGEVVQRKDDSEEVVRDRIVTYHRDTAPVFGFFKQIGLIAEIDGLGDIQDISDRLRRALK